MTPARRGDDASGHSRAQYSGDNHNDDYYETFMHLGFSMASGKAANVYAALNGDLFWNNPLIQYVFGKDNFLLGQRMEPASSSTSFEIPAVFACRLVGKNCGKFKTD